MKSLKTTLPKYILLCLGLILGLTLMQMTALVAVAVIPVDSIQTNMEASADFLCEKPVFFQLDDSHSGSVIDRYADSILLNILYCYDSSHPLESVMRSSYYYTAEQNENENLSDAVYGNLSANKEYSRYWHGSIVILRPLLTFLTLPQIYVLLGCVMLLLFAALLFSVWKKLGAAPVLPLLFGSILMSFWYIPFSLEYTWTIPVMMISTIVLLWGYEHYEKKQKATPFLLVLFLVTGSMTAYLDFLTTETLTLLVPLAFYLALSHKNAPVEKLRDGIKRLLSPGIAWVSGYLSCWLCKWMLATLILKENAFAAALNQAGERVYGEVDITGILKYPLTLMRNLGCIFPFHYAGLYAFIPILAVVLGIAGFFYLFHKKNTLALSGIYFLLMLVPYVRFLVLANHAYLHCFFTYRAQFASVICLGFILIYGTDAAFFKKKRRKK